MRKGTDECRKRLTISGDWMKLDVDQISVDYNGWDVARSGVGSIFVR
jgi:hypothetical protein